MPTALSHPTTITLAAIPVVAIGSALSWVFSRQVTRHARPWAIAVPPLVVGYGYAVLAYQAGAPAWVAPAVLLAIVLAGRHGWDTGAEQRIQRGDGY